MGKVSFPEVDGEFLFKRPPGIRDWHLYLVRQHTSMCGVFHDAGAVRHNGLPDKQSVCNSCLTALADLHDKQTGDGK